MSTRSAIAIVKPTGIVGVYCHYDGYPDGVGRVLHKHYNTIEKVEKLLSYGNISCLSEKIGRKHNFNNHLKEHEDWCLFYKRDRGEKDQEAHHFGTFEGFEEWYSWSSYYYIFKDNSWRYKSSGDILYHDLATAIKQLDLVA